MRPFASFSKVLLLACIYASIPFDFLTVELEGNLSSAYRDFRPCSFMPRSDEHRDRNSSDAPVSEHLKNRHETGAVLRKKGPRSSSSAVIVVGNGSTSWEMIRCLTERLPVMICPRWVTIRTQPIAVDDVLAYLLAAL